MLKKMFLDREGVSGEYIIYGIAAAGVSTLLVLLAVYWRSRTKSQVGNTSNRLDTIITRIPTSP